MADCECLHKPFSVLKFLTTFFLLASSCFAVVLDVRPQPIGTISQRGNELDDRLINADLHERAVVEPRDTTTSSRFLTATAVATPLSISSPTSSRTSVSSAAASASFTGLPQPFDGPLGNNFTTTTCPTLFMKIINDPAVKNCVPISLLIQGSQSFFRVERNNDALDRTLDISCNAIASSCNTLFQNYASQVNSGSGCQQELSQQNQRVQWLFYGLVSYLPIYSAACLKLSATNTSSSSNGSQEYCFTSAVDNFLNPADLALFTLPVGSSLANNSRPSCSSCTKQTMAIYNQAARNLTSPLSSAYVPAAQVINAACGNDFVNATFTPIPNSDMVSSAITLQAGSSILTILLVVGTFMML